MSSSTAEERFLSVLLALFAGIALALATTGVYGVIAYSVSHRRREIGVRMALGADAHRVVGGVLLGAVSMAVVGVAVGTGIVTLLARPIEGMLFGVPGDDPGTKLLVGAVLLAVSVVAAYVPARRAARVAPSEALSAE
jgi:ABC-type antimicrobial peptide transport system permease subunit